MKKIVSLILFLTTVNYGNGSITFQQSTLLENIVNRKFSDPTTKDKFSITIIGESLIKGMMVFQIVDANGSEILTEKYPANYLIGYGLNPDATVDEQENYIKKRVDEFFKDENFHSPAIELESKFDEDESDYQIWNDIKSDSSAVGFFCLIGEEGFQSIAYSKKLKKVVVYFSCC
jgi:hypothetical protein